MLNRAQVMLAAGLLMLSASAALTYIARRARSGQPLIVHHCRLHAPRKTLALLRRCLFLRSDAPELDALHDIAQRLTESLLLLRRDAAGVPPLPGGPEPRLMALARHAPGSGVDAAALQRMLMEWDADDVTSAERMALPVCTACVVSERLRVTLRTLLQDDHDRRSAIRLAARLSRSKRPMSLLTRRQFSLTELATLLSQLRAQRQSLLLELTSEWLAVHDADPESIAERHTRRQAAIVDDLHAAADQLSSLHLLDWSGHAEACDPLHELLLSDPSGLYPRMTLPSRRLIRERTEQLSHWLRVDNRALVTAALHLCKQAEGASLESHVGYYLLEHSGVSALRAYLGLRRGRIRCFLQVHRVIACRAVLWAFSIVSAILFLNDGHPLFMLPAFWVVAGQLPRALIRRFLRPEKRPSVEISAVSDELRTLVVLPSVFGDASDVLHALRRLRTGSAAFPEDGVDFMLLGDYAPAMTQRSSSDAAVISAAVQGISALCDTSASDRFMYMQRARAWQAVHRTFSARGGQSGALESICRLIAQGECEDYFDHATLSPAALHRRYAFVLLLDEMSEPAPGMLLALLSAASHPLNMRYPLPDGVRGCSCFSPAQAGTSATSDSRGVRLIRPDAYLESLDGQMSAESEDDCGFLADALSGTQIVPEARAYRSGMQGILSRVSASCRRAYRRCRMLRWLTPWVDTPDGIKRNPLPSAAQYELRERFRSSCLPVLQCMLLLWALLERNTPLTVIALALPAALRVRREPWLALEQSVLLPLHAASSAYAGFRACLPMLARREPPGLREPENWTSLQIWSQGTAAIVCFLLGVVVSPVWPPALLTAALFASYPLLHMREVRALAPDQTLPSTDEPALRRIAEATWRFFTDTVDASPCALPPAREQMDPPVSMPAQTTPESAGMYLLAVVCAKETGFISAEEAGERIASALGVLTALPLRHGLPCVRYSIPELDVLDDAVDTRSCAILLTALTAAAQALRSWLPGLPPHMMHLPAALDALADSFDIHRLYDPSAQLFYQSLDSDGIGVGHALYFSDVSLLLSVTACARGVIPPEHFCRLSRTCTKAGGESLPLSMHGDLLDYLIPLLFMPFEQATARRIVLLNQKRGRSGLWGLSRCAEHTFTPELHYRRSMFGLRELAVNEPASRPVYPAYAAALALTCTPSAALRCLQEMQQLGAFGAHGFAESVDLSADEPHIVQMQDAFHQGLILCAASHVLADAPLHRYFSELPMIGACLPLLSHADVPPIVLPQRPLYTRNASVHAIPVRTGSASVVPVDAHLIGSADASYCMNALGSSRMVAGDVPLTRFTGDPMAVEGMQIYLIAQGRVYRLSDPTQHGEITFGGGSIRIERICGCFRVRLTILTDPVGGRFLHLLDVANLSTSDQAMEVADILPADLNAPADTLCAEHPSGQHLLLHSRSDGRTLHQHICLSQPATQCAVCTDSAAFLGRGRTFAAPASLEEPMADLYATSCADCLSFRVRLLLGGRASARILFTTGLSSLPPPSWQEVNRLISVAELHAQAVAESIPISPQTLLAASRMMGALLWRDQPHQGARVPLETSLAEPLMHAQSPILTVTVPDEPSVLRLQECLHAAAWVMLHGQPLTVYILCTVQTSAAAQDAANSCLHAADRSTVRVLTDASDLLQEAIFAISGVVIRGEGRSLAAQLNALQRSIADREEPLLPAPGRLPEMTLQNSGGYGGFDPESGDYIIRLNADQTTPIPWPITVTGEHFSFTADEAGFRSPFGERLMLSIDGCSPFDPLCAGLPTTVRVHPGGIQWRIMASRFTLTLDAALLPGHPAGLRAIRLKNHGKENLSAVMTVTAGLAPAPIQHLTTVDDTVFATGSVPGFLAAAEGDWTADVADTVDLSFRHAGSRAARLTLGVTVAAGLSCSAAWLCGVAASADDAAAAQQVVRDSGVSVCLRTAREDAAAKLPHLSISTPEPTLDLLVNHVLPRQALSAGITPAANALSAPDEVRTDLLQTVSRMPSGSLQPALMTAMYLHLTGDPTILDLPVNNGALLIDVCRAAITARSIDRSETDPPHQRLCEVFLAAAAANELASFTDDNALHAHRRGVLSAANAFLWHTDHYGAQDQLLLDVQACAALAMGDTPRSRRCLRACWDTLYDRENGVIRQQLPTHAIPCPGTMRNGGQDTAAAVLYLAALASLGEMDMAWELLRALNPLHHTDDPVRSEAYAGPPWLLAESIQTAPAFTGRALGNAAASADLLTSVVLTEMLGLTRRDESIVMKPRVPSDWDGFSITLQIGTATWRIDMERDLHTAQQDGLETNDEGYHLHDDGKIHQLRLPLK